MRVCKAAWLVLALGLGALGGWFARDHADRAECAYTANGYGRFEEDLGSLASLPLERVNTEVLLSIQRCWAAHPYGGPQHSISLVDAWEAPSGGYYAVFEPGGITDVQLAFRVQANGVVTKAYQVGRFGQPARGRV